MDINTLLRSHKCSCGRTHVCNIKNIVIGDGAINKISSLTDGYRNIILVADKNTYSVCGDEVSAQLGIKLQNKLIYQCDGILIPNENAVNQLKSLIVGETDLIVGIGSGVIQDICKYVSFNAHLPYYIVATAPSMDGYASKGAAMIMNNMKITYNAQVPQVIIADTKILSQAPMEMIQSGYGDIIGKFSCLNDWKLSALINNEYFCTEIYDLTYNTVLKTKPLAKKLKSRDKNAIKTLTEALIVVGIAMAYAENSRPASGSEHHLSHFFEIVGILNNEPYFSHGIDVAYSALCTQKIREFLLSNISENSFNTKSTFNYVTWVTDIKRIYTNAANEVISLQNELGWYNKNRLPVYKDKTNEIKVVLGECPTSDEIAELLTEIGLDINDFYNLYGKGKIEDAVKYGKDLKDRYSVLWLYYDLHKFFK